MHSKWRQRCTKITALFLTLILLTPIHTLNTKNVEATSISIQTADTYIKSGQKLFYKSGSITSGKTPKLVTRKSGQSTSKAKVLTSIDTNPFFLRGTYLYFTTSKGIYRIREDGKYKKQLFKSTSARIIGFSGSYMYYLTKNGATTTIRRMKATGTNDQKLTSYKRGGSLTDPNVVMAFNRIYYIHVDDSAIDKNGGYPTGAGIDLSYVSLGGKVNKQVISDQHLENLYANDNGVYFKYSKAGEYNTKMSIVSINKTNKLTELATISDQSDSASLLAVSGNKLYYNYGDSLYKVAATGGTSSKIINKSNISGINGSAAWAKLTVKGNWIAAGFDCDEAPWEWYTFTTSGTSVKKVANTVHSNTVDIVGNRLYYAATKKPLKSIEADGVYYYKGLTLE